MLKNYFSVALIPRWPNLNHWGKGVLHIDFTDGSKYDDLSKVINKLLYTLRILNYFFYTSDFGFCCSQCTNT